MSAEVWAATSWPNNAAMMADFLHLYVKPSDVVLDMTYGKGNFWSVTRPQHLIAHDLYTLDGVDYTALPEADDSIDVAVFDPTYVAPGGRETSTIPTFNGAYGMDRTGVTPTAQLEEIADGLCEARRVLRRRGTLALKVMNYVSSGRRQNYVGWAYQTLQALGFELVDELILVGRPGPQPTRNRDGSVRRQVHARNNHSYLLIAKKR